MNIKLIILAPLAMLYLMIGQVYAAICSHVSGPGQVTVDIDESFYNGDVGGPDGEGESHLTEQIIVECEGFWGRHVFRKYETSLPVTVGPNNVKYLKVNDNIRASVQVMNQNMGLVYTPTQDPVGILIPHWTTNGKYRVAIQDYGYIVKLQIVKPFVGQTRIPNTTLMNVFAANDDAITNIIWGSKPIYTIGIQGIIVTRESCEIKGGELVIDFGEISPRAFGRVGAGNKANDVAVATKDIEIQCIGTNDTAKVSVRLTADKVQDDMLVSDNNDIGFKVSDEHANVLIPNNRNSRIPLQLNDSRSSVGIKVWPVSVTGAMPAPGPFKSRAMLNVDFE